MPMVAYSDFSFDFPWECASVSPGKLSSVSFIVWRTKHKNDHDENWFGSHDGGGGGGGGGRGLLRFPIWLISYFQKTFVFTLSTPSGNVKFCPSTSLEDLFYSNPLGSYEQFEFCYELKKIKLHITSQWIWLEKIPLHVFIILFIE